MTQHYAHTLPDRPESDWEPLADHLHLVADLASEFSADFGAGEWGKLIGLWHDLGKYSAEFQNYLRRSNGIEAHLETLPGKVDHSTAGAKHAVERMGPLGRILAYCIAGHHAGLANATITQVSSGPTNLERRLASQIPDYSAAPVDLLQASIPDDPLPSAIQDCLRSHGDKRRASFQLSLFCRMLFSCLVDADFLATEAFMSPPRSSNRPTNVVSLQDLEAALFTHLEQLVESRQGDVNASRNEVLKSCCDAATLPPGLFSLTVPTGGGKTLSSLAFALRHALAHQGSHRFRRIIFAIPFTSIIEQTAEVYRKVFSDLGRDVVLEHHSNLDADLQSPTARLASENWDAPLVVTTNVQFFESLFANRTSRCRKLHRIAGSVIILDEAQTLPVELLEPCLAILRELAAGYCCTIVLCTATQPVVVRRDGFPIGLEDVREIIPDPRSLYERMRRVRVQSLNRESGKLLPTSDHELSERLATDDHRQSLTIVNTRRHAASLFNAVAARLHRQEMEGVFHLSTFMCAAHRAQTLKEIRRRLQRAVDLPCRVISTQLIEAGVDVDFPTVFRAVCGLDSLAQAAGRCNREGHQQQGVVYLFRPEARLGKGMLASMAHTAEEVIDSGRFDDFLSLGAISEYFRLHYWKQADLWDKHQVMQCFPSPPENLAFYFADAAQLFRIIQDDCQPVIVEWDDAAKRLVNQLRAARDAAEAPDWRIKRRLQPYLVPVYRDVFPELVGSDVEVMHDGQYAVLLNRDMYDDRLGLCLERARSHDPNNLIVGDYD